MRGTRPGSRRSWSRSIEGRARSRPVSCDAEIVLMLLERGADPNARSQSGGTPLHTAAFTGDHEVAGRLLARGADPAIANRDGKTALDIARERRHTEVARLLEERARPD